METSSKGFTIKIRKSYTDKQLIQNLIEVAKKLKKNTLTQFEFQNSGLNICSSKLFRDRFKSWNNALEKAGLNTTKEMNITKEKLLKNLLDVAEKLGRSNLSKENLIKPYTKYSISAYNANFGNWSKTKTEFKKYFNSVNKEMKNKLTDSIKIKKTYTDSDLIKNLNEVAKKLKRNTLTQFEFQNSGSNICSSKLFRDRFETWNKALEKAGLIVSKEMNISEDDLLKNLIEVAEKLGSINLLKVDLTKNNSKYSISAYNQAFGSWTKSKIKFSDYLNSLENSNKQNLEINIDYTKQRNHKTKKTIKVELKNAVKRKFKFICSIPGCNCGEAIGSRPEKYKKPLTVVHIKPWEEGGETEINNLKVLCSTHYSESIKNKKAIVRSRKIDPKIKAMIFERDRHRCVNCKRGPFEKGNKFFKDIVIDHIHPFSKNGGNDFKNLQTLCKECNAKKMDKIY